MKRGEIVTREFLLTHKGLRSHTTGIGSVAM